MINILKYKKSTLTHEEANMLVGRFFDGETTLNEEQSLYQYFASENAHPSLQQYGEMFGWYGNGMQTTSTKHHAWRWTKYAAAALLTGVIGTVAIKLMMLPADNNDKLAEIYAGSYIIRNGKKITDIKEVLPQAIEQEKYADQIIEQCQRASDEMSDIEIATAEDAISSIPYPEVRKQLAN